MARYRIVAFAAFMLLVQESAGAQEPGGLRGPFGDEPLAPATEGAALDPGDAAEDAFPTENVVIPGPPPTRLTIGPDPVEEIEEPRLRRREAEPFAPLGLRAGAFILYPGVEVGGVVTDNVRQEKRNRKSDVGLRVLPDLAVQSDWVRHSLRITGAGDFTFYDQEKDFDRAEFDAAARLRLDVRRSTTLDGEATYGLSQTSSSDSEVPDDAVGQRSDQEYAVATALTHRASRLEMKARAGASWLVYGDVDLAGGGVEDNSDRDYVEPLAALRFGYQAAASLAPFIEGGYTPRLHRRERDRSGLRRDSEGGFARVGAAIEASEIWSGEAALRVDTRHYEDRRLDDHTLVGFDANVTWRPSRLTTVRLVGETGLEESSLDNVSAVRSYEIALEATHALRENLAWRGELGFSFEDYPGKSLDERTTFLGLDLAYIVRRDMELLLGYEFTHVDSEVRGDGYTENRVTAGVRFRL